MSRAGGPQGPPASSVEATSDPHQPDGAIAALLRSFRRPPAALSGALTVRAALPCSSPSDTKKANDSGKGGVLVVDYEKIDLIPGAGKQVKVKSGQAETAEAPKDAGMTTKVEGKDARESTHQVTVKGGNLVTVERMIK
jgi:hypothetical protein